MPEIKTFACDKCRNIIPQQSSKEADLVRGVIIEGNIFAADGVGNGGLVGDNIKKAIANGVFVREAIDKKIFCIGCLLDVIYADVGDVRAWLKNRTNGDMRGPG